MINMSQGLDSLFLTEYGDKIVRGEPDHPLRCYVAEQFITRGTGSTGMSCPCAFKQYFGHVPICTYIKCQVICMLPNAWKTD